MPAQGAQVLGFGEKTQFGGQSKGIVIETRQGAQVTSPCDGWIVYAGEFRSYGQLLIINAGGGYHVLLAGLSQIDVQPGQFVLAAEPVGTMSGCSAQAAPPSHGRQRQSPPVLYVEFRKDGQPIDPDPWWVGGSSKGARIMRKTDFAFWTFLLMTGLAGATTRAERHAHVFGDLAELRALPPARSLRRRARAGPLRLRREARRHDADRVGHQRHAVGARPALLLPEPQELPRHAGADARRVRRPRHRGHHGERRRQGRLADRRHARRQGRPAGQRPHHASRQRADRRA